MSANKTPYSCRCLHEMSDIIQESEPSSEFDDVPITDEPDDDETEIEEED
jgi:hypothetical protein